MVTSITHLGSLFQGKGFALVLSPCLSCCHPTPASKLLTAFPFKLPVTKKFPFSCCPSSFIRMKSRFDRKWECTMDTTLILFSQHFKGSVSSPDQTMCHLTRSFRGGTFVHEFLWRRFLPQRTLVKFCTACVQILIISAEVCVRVLYSSSHKRASPHWPVNPLHGDTRHAGTSRTPSVLQPISAKLFLSVCKEHKRAKLQMLQENKQKCAMTSGVSEGRPGKIKRTHRGYILCIHVST